MVLSLKFLAAGAIGSVALLGAVAGCASLIGADFDRPSASGTAGDAGALEDAGVDSSPVDGASVHDAMATADAAPSCGGEEQACCENSACSPGLACISAVCVPRALLVGGEGVSGFLNDAWEWDGTSWTAVAAGPSARAWAMGTAFNGLTLVYGGFYSSSLGAESGDDYDDVWTWNGVKWSHLSAAGPTARNNGIAGTAAGDVVVFGGLEAQAVSDTWTFNGTTWSESFPTGSGVPEARFGAAGASDGTSFHLFGGVTPEEDGGSALHGDLRKWNGSTWTNISATPAPSPRVGASMVSFDGKLLLYGGYGGANASTTLDETWLWDGTSWTNTGAVGPPGGRGYPALAAFNGVVVMFGGFSSTGVVEAGTWVWNGSTWTDTKASGPPARAGALLIAR
jgi:hypothetical protein